MIEVIACKHIYPGQDEPTIQNIDFRIARGECVGLMGPSGSGKSTIARIITGFIKPTEGRIIIDKQEVTAEPSRKIILISQESDLFPWQNVQQHVEFALLRKDPAGVRNLLQLVRLDGHEKKYPSELSGGMKKRLSLARALAINPQLLILDEAFNSLDSGLKKELQSDLNAIWQQSETAILLVTHDRKDLENLAQSVINLSQARPATIADIEII